MHIDACTLHFANFSAPRARNLEHISNHLHTDAPAMLYAFNTTAPMGSTNISFQYPRQVQRQASDTRDVQHES